MVASSLGGGSAASVRLTSLALLCACSGAPVGLAPPLHDRGRMHDLLAMLAERGEGREVAIAHVPVDGDGGLSAVAGDVRMHAASTMKVPVMIELFRRADRGELDLDGEMVLRNRFASIVDGSPFTVDPAEDSDTELYARVGEPVAVRELIRRMIVRSSNLATNVLVELAGAARIQHTCAALGARHTLVRRGVEDSLAFRQGLNNETTAVDLAILLRAIARGEAARPESCAAMIEVLAAQEFNDMIPAGLPGGWRVAHKTGSITRHRHDAAIVLPPAGRPFVLVVMTRGFDDPQESAAVIAEVARAVQAHVTQP